MRPDQVAEMDAVVREERHGHLDRRVAYYPPDDAARAAHEAMRAAVAELGHKAIDTCPESPELAKALTVLTDEVLAGFNAAIARHRDRLPTHE